MYDGPESVYYTLCTFIWMQTGHINNLTTILQDRKGLGWRESLQSKCYLLSFRINVLTFVKLALVQCCQYVLAPVLTRHISERSLEQSLILIRNTIMTTFTRCCYVAPLILQLSLNSLVVKSVPVALSGRKFHNMSNGVRGDNVRRAGSKSHFCSSPLILRFTYAAGWQMTQCAVQAASLFPGHLLLPEW